MSDALSLTLQQLPEAVRPAIEALFALDRRLEELARRTRDPLVAQMRLTWWAEALTALGTRPAPAEPLLQSLAETVVVRGIAGARLAAMVDGWDMLLEDRPLDEAGLSRFAAGRGGVLFDAAAELLGHAFPPAALAGEAWALADLAPSVAPPERESAQRLTEERWREATATRWPTRLRPLGGLALLDILPLGACDGSSGGLAAAWRMLRFRLTGR
ncbi:squalene/phytoene synthase family protein [Sphingomonas floccifaciens]|uniref:Squalene/phytoene synthase family protein n=1 Tax=Sphingomonas floccifaciens TaxID=1844115 RepID=A0ABW4NAY8_9SPHN